jgi:hypothetical protein
LRAITSGNNLESILLKTQLRSLPVKLDLKLPNTTPSGLSIGTILKITLSLRKIAAGVLLVIKVRNPSMTQLLLVSPG